MATFSLILEIELKPCLTLSGALSRDVPIRPVEVAGWLRVAYRDWLLGMELLRGRFWALSTR
jgi:hypothetical protein